MPFRCNVTELMKISGKVPHSFYCFLQTRGFDLSRFLELTPLEMEVIKDPSSWVAISKVESLLKNLFSEYSSHFVDEDFIVCVGHSCFELGAWGELDSVLKMRGTQPVFSNLPVFLSYFISEGFSIREFREESGFLNFKSNLSSEDFPFVTEYMRSVMETLPVYTNRQRAEAKWIREYVQIQWDSEQQTSLFPASTEFNLKPELLSDLRYFLEKVEKELYEQHRLLRDKDHQIQKLKDQLLLQGIPSLENIYDRIIQIEQSLEELKGFLSGKGLDYQPSIEDKEYYMFIFNQVDVALQHLLELKNLLSD